MIGLILVMYALFYAVLNSDWLDSNPNAQWVKRLYIWLVVGFYFIYSWFKDRTVGMKSWHLYVVNKEGLNPSLTQLIMRYIVATFSTLLLGFGFWFALLSRENLTWHDVLTGTRLVRVES